MAALNGAATGAGFQIALCADIRVAHPGVRLGQPEVRVGMASVVGTYMMTLHLSLSRNVELSLAGGLIDAAREQLEVSTGLAPGDTLLLGGARGIPAGSSVQVGVAAGKE